MRFTTSMMEKMLEMEKETKKKTRQNGEAHFRNPQPPPGRVFTDVTLVCKDGKRPAAHNGILTSTSPFFINILKRTA